MNRRQRLGQKGEEAVALFLAKLGYKIITSNYRCRLGEIDIIAQDRDELVFVEVKTRSDLSYGTPAASVTLRKQQQIIKAAHNYLAENNLFESPARFDVVSVLSPPKGQLTIDHIKNAFEL